MLGMILRGIFLLSILTWYSTNVWKMIDGYFRDQFRSYLEEEYRKNPRMKSDVRGESVGKVESPVTTPRHETTAEPQRETLEIEAKNTRAAEAVENDTAIESNETLRVTGGTSENETPWGSTDKNAFLGAAAESGLQSRKLENGQDSPQLINHSDRDLEQGNDDSHGSVAKMSKSFRKKIKNAKKPAAPRDISRRNSRNARKIRLNEKNFELVARNRVSNDDFWEFEEDVEETRPLEGILVSELPFKPRADIGDLERVTTDEYCPLTLEEKSSCDETYKWL